MKKNLSYFYKIFFFISTFCSTVIGGIFFLLLSPAYAQTVHLQIPILGVHDITVCSGGLCYGISLYIIKFVEWFVGAISLIAVVAIMGAGVIWLTAEGNQQRVNFAKKMISDAIGGLLLTLGVYLLLSIISPDLVHFKAIHIP